MAEGVEIARRQHFEAPLVLHGQVATADLGQFRVDAQNRSRVAEVLQQVVEV
ncbi:MAG: hypothetical protein K0A98_03135 [Trueperaceae bacterium]|nr:hypothetical protein [Trueperaceae bacterium]